MSLQSTITERLFVLCCSASVGRSSVAHIHAFQSVNVSVNAPVNQLVPKDCQVCSIELVWF